ncbi:MAG: hypothetical protein HY900_22075 [Deltaproteobacteria bacterium]|nr:hypothetical protein [Deltaproteobacteria bacterium]
MRKILVFLALGGVGLAAAGPSPAAVSCDVSMSQSVYHTGDKVTVSTLRVKNTESIPVSVHVETWKEQPVGANATFQEYNGTFQGGMDQDFAPKTLFTVVSSTTVGSYRFGCRILDPVTGGLLAEDVVQYSVNTPLAVAADYLQYRTFENPASNRYAGWVDLRRNGSPIVSSDVSSVIVKNPGGSVIQSTTFGFFGSTYHNYSAGRNLSDPVSGSGYWIGFPAGTVLSSGTYLVEVTDGGDGSVLKDGIDFPGRVELVPVAAASVSYQWEDPSGDLHLWWTEPADVHDDVYATFSNAIGEFLYVRGLKGRSEVVIPRYVIDAAKGLNPGAVSWTLKFQTRKNDVSGVNYARSYSNAVTVNLP